MARDETPGVLGQAAGLVVSIARHASAGFAPAGAELKARRLELCGACEHLTPAGKCGKCGCVMSIKAGWAAADCPVGKW